MPDGKYGRLITERDLPALIEATREVLREHGTRAHLSDDEIADLALQRLDAAGSLTIPASEPLFLLRAQDEITVETVQDYLGTARDAGAPQEHLDGVRAQHDLIVAWRNEHPDSIKVPD